LTDLTPVAIRAVRLTFSESVTDVIYQEAVDYIRSVCRAIGSRFVSLTI